MSIKELIPIFLLATISWLLLVPHSQPAAPSPYPSFSEYLSVYSISYSSSFERSYRERVYKERVEAITAHNSDPDRTYEKGVNQFTHLTREEFRQQNLGFRGRDTNRAVDEGFVSVGDIDWVAAGAVTRVKNQGRCASCYAFSATGALEGLKKISEGTLSEFSEQELVDCTLLDGNQGCDGGLMDYCFKYVQKRGIASEREYPYTEIIGICHEVGGKFKIAGYTDYPGCTALANALVKGPVAVALDAANWDDYK